MKEQPDPIDVHVGARLRLLRAARRLSLEELGRRVGVTYQQIQKYETGANRISASTLFRLAQTFEMSPLYFFEGLEKEGVKDTDALTDRETLRSSIALRRIEDAEVRHHLSMLIEALDPTALRPGQRD